MCHLDRAIRLRAQPAENAFSQIQARGSNPCFIDIRNRARWTYRRRWTRIFPLGEVDLGTATAEARSGRIRCKRIRLGYDTCSQALTQNFKHRSDLSIGARIREVETFVYDREIGNDVPQNCLAECRPIL